MAIFFLKGQSLESPTPNVNDIMVPIFGGWILERSVWSCGSASADHGMGTGQAHAHMEDRRWGAKLHTLSPVLCAAGRPSEDAAHILLRC